ncbi:MAG: hypothetical protein KAX49_14755 [Halanaerobiales bacterium]|nr:hypothetical protein [Halanaerobiales bacterium]
MKKIFIILLLFLVLCVGSLGIYANDSNVNSSNANGSNDYYTNDSSGMIVYCTPEPNIE